MASSGWQGQKDIQTGKYPHMALNLNVWDVAHSGTTLTFKATVRVVCTSGNISWNPASVSLTGGGSQSVNLNLSTGRSADTGTFSCSIGGVSASTTSYTVTSSLNAGGVASGSASWTLSFDASGSAPSSGYVTYNSCTWNSVTATTGVGSWGTQAGSFALCLCTGSSNGAAASLDYNTWFTNARYEEKHASGGASSAQYTITNSSNKLNSPIQIKGLLQYKLAFWNENDYGNTRNISTLRYLPPAPLQSIAYTQTQNSTNVTVNLTITGGSSTNNYTANVTTSWRYSTNGGSTYSSWATIGSAATPWTAKTASFTCNYQASVVIQAKQTYQSLDSEIKQVSFTATSGTAPSGGSITVTGSTWNTITMSASGVNYGKPDSISGRKMAIGVGNGYQQRSYKRENQVFNSTSATTTVNNSSLYPSAQPLELKGMLPVYPYLWVWNTISASDTYWGQAYYLPPAPPQFSYTDPGNAGTKTYPVRFTGVAANNYDGYTASELTRTVRYKIDDGAWTTVTQAVTPLTDVTSFNVSVPASSMATVEGYMTYRGKNSETVTITINNTNLPSSLYGSVNGQTKKVVKLYGSVNGHAKEIRTLYGSVGGVAKKIYES